MSDFDYLFKILLIGNSGVGKSCMLSRYSDNYFTEDFISTIGVDFKIKTLSLNSKNVKFQIWDTAGQERFKNIVSSYFKAAHAIIIMYDCNNRESFINLNCWIDQALKFANKDVLLILVGNKSDLDKRVSSQEASEYSKSNNLLFFEVSCKNNEGIDEVFNVIGNKLISES